jgi:hypothetical protein
MKKLFILLVLVPFLLIDYGCKENSTEPTDIDTNSIHVRKPNLYIYPNQTLSLTVDIDFPKGGQIVESIPEYNNTWNITVKPNGKINDIYDFIYYECKVPAFGQNEFGWIIEKQNLKEFFDDNLIKSGFNQIETNDFIEYWIPNLIDCNYYEIYPQYKTVLDEVININFSIEPNSFYRLCYIIIGRNDNNLILKEPKIERANRSGYFVVEWGVVLK